MQQLTGLDNSFLVTETGGALGHVGALWFFDTENLGGRSFFHAVRATIEERLHLLAPYRRRLVEVPFGLDRPYWVEDPGFDLDFHVRHVAVPPPGDEEQLSALVARIHARALDRARPLWEVYVIEGLADGRVALYTKIHHCAVDGVAGAQLAAVLLDSDPAGDEVSPAGESEEREPLPSWIAMLARGLLGAPSSTGRVARILGRTAQCAWKSRDPIGAVTRRASVDRIPLLGRRSGDRDADPGPDRSPPTSVPRTPWNGSISPHRRVAFFSHPLPDYKTIKRTFETTLNDVVMAVTASALRRYLEDVRALPEDPLVAMVPVSLRTADQKGECTNRVTIVPGELATEVEDPVERLQRIHATMMRVKRGEEPTSGSLIADWLEAPIPAVSAGVASLVARTRLMDRLTPLYNVIVSNVPGPRQPLYCGGAKLLAYHPISAIGDGQGLNVTVVSYRDHLDYGLVACRELVPDLWRFKHLFGEGLEELRKAADRAVW
jgi:WS/DGAT/MGAT family acyltransferase